MESAASNPDSQEVEEDMYDPRNPDYILPASTFQVEEINIAMFEKQIFRLQCAISQQKNENEERLLEHYRIELFHLQCSLRAALDRRDRAAKCGDSDDGNAKRGSWFAVYFPVL